MSIKKLLLSTLLLTTTGFAYAQETTDDYIQIDDCIIEAGLDDPDEGYIDINLVNTTPWCALQFDLVLPEGVEFALDDSDELDWLPDEVRFQPIKEGKKTYYFNTECVRQSDGAYRFIAYNTRNHEVFDGEEDYPNFPRKTDCL